MGNTVTLGGAAREGEDAVFEGVGGGYRVRRGRVNTVLIRGENTVLRIHGEENNENLGGVEIRYCFGKAKTAI